MFSPLTAQLIDSLRGLPGIGPKSAQRMAFQLLAKPGQAKALALADALQQAVEKVGHCARCRIFTEHEICDLCRNPKRDGSTLCIAESPADVMAVEQTSSYRGLYFVLHGHLSPLDGIGPNDIGLPILFDRLDKEPVRELIIATNLTMEGKATAHYIASHIDSANVKCSRIAHGVPVGGELEYLDGSTLTLALQARLPMQDTERR